MYAVLVAAWKVYPASVRWPAAVVVGRLTRSPSKSAEVPSPPSAIGVSTICASRITERTPSASHSAASAAVAVDLNESGATTIFGEGAGSNGAEAGEVMQQILPSCGKNPAVRFHLE